MPGARGTMGPGDGCVLHLQPEPGLRTSTHRLTQQPAMHYLPDAPGTCRARLRPLSHPHPWADGVSL